MLNKFIEKLFILSALMSLICVLVITGLIFLKGFPLIVEFGFLNFIFGTTWNPQNNMYGILPMIIGSFLTTLGALSLGVPLAILTAVYVSEYAPKFAVKFINPIINLLSGIPSVVYGFFGLMIVVPLIDESLGGRGSGNSLLAAVIILSIMILPTIVNISKTAINSVPKEYKEASLVLGATKERTIFKVVIPAAKSGIISGVILGTGRAVGETMAVILVSGNAILMPQVSNGFLVTITDPIRTMTSNIAIEMGYANGMHQNALFATGVVLFIFIMLINLSLGLVTNRGEEGKKA